MPKTRRKKQISDEAIDQFKTTEIEKIKRFLPSKKPSKRFPLFASLSMGAIVILIACFTLVPSQSNATYSITKHTNTAYLLEAKEPKFNFQFYYDFDIVKRGERTNYNNTFDYFVPAVYASDTSVETIDVSLDVYKYDQFRYFLAITVNEETRYLEANVFKNHRDPLMLDALEIETFDANFKALNDLLTEYPPQQLSDGSHYEPHPAIDSLEASRAKANYVTYVEHYYTEENTFGENDLENQAIPTFVLQRHQIVVNDAGNIVDTDFFTAIGWGEISNLESYLSNFDHNQLFDFIPVDRDRPFPSSSIDFTHASHGVKGHFKAQHYEDETLYIASTIYLNFSPEGLNNTAYAVIDYTLEEAFDQDSDSLTIDTFFFNRALIIPPQHIPITFDTPVDIYEIFDAITITFYDDDDEPLHTVAFNNETH